jgi:DNA-directed RNA polymerase specialized sigma24 family protein
MPSKSSTKRPAHSGSRAPVPCDAVCRAAAREAQPLGGEVEAPMNGSATDWPELRAAIALLPERQRQALFLRHYAELSYEEIAEVLGIARGTVSATLHAAHNALRAVLLEMRR